MSSSGGSHSRLGLTIGGDGRVTCHHYEGKTPILVIDAGDSAVSISPAGRDACGAAVEFARALARKAQEFADDIERMNAAQPPNADSGADGDDSTTKATDSKAA
jgi:hypothetical protein